METKKDRFQRLATIRTNSVLQKLKILGNCSNRQAYEYSEQEIKKIFSAIEEQIKIVKSKFTFPKEDQFQL